MSPADVVVVGGGPAGAMSAALLARRGRHVVLLERSPVWRWRACGVFSSPAAVMVLRRAGLSEEALASAALPIPAMRVELPGAATFRLTYGDDGTLMRPAVGFARQALDEELLEIARRAGVEVRRGSSVVDVSLGTGRQRLNVREGDGPVELEARVVVGADGVRSTVARAARVVRRPRLGQRIGLTFHASDPRPSGPARDARMVILEDAYCGLAPVPGGRLNVGIVLAGARWRRRLAARGAGSLATELLSGLPRAEDDPVDWASAPRIDTIEGAVPLGHRVSRRSGGGWVLVGDAAGFLDPLTGEGLHRALVSAELAADAVDGHLRGVAGSLAGYERAMDRRFAAKDAVTLLIQAFLRRPALFRHAARRLSRSESLRETMGLVIGDLVPATRALDPAFLAALLRP